MAGLVNYIMTEGKFNEHHRQRLIGGSEFVTWKWGEHRASLSRDEWMGIARWLDRPSRLHDDVSVAGGHVWHCSLSLKPTDKVVADEEWEQIAREFLVSMGFEKADGLGLRWAAFHHGASRGGNDHIHLVVNLIGDDGTKADVWQDFRRAGAACSVIEREHQLETVEGREFRRGLIGYNQGERARVEDDAWRAAERRYERVHRDDEVAVAWAELDSRVRYQLLCQELTVQIPRYRLGGVVRECVASASTEFEFVQGLRGAGLWVHPHYAVGGMDKVAGYSVAFPPGPGEKPVWYSGTRLARDLTLPRLRDSWDEDTDRRLTVAAWTVAQTGERIGAVPGLSSSSARVVNELMDKVMTALRDVDPFDTEEWSRVARQCAGVLYGMSRRSEPVPGDLAHAAHALSVSAQTGDRERRRSRVDRRGLVGVARLGVILDRGSATDLVLLRQMMSLARSVGDAARARSELVQAKALDDAWRGELTRVYQVMNSSRGGVAEPYRSPSAVPVSAIGKQVAATGEYQYRHDAEEVRSVDGGTPYRSPGAVPVSQIKKTQTPRPPTRRGNAGGSRNVEGRDDERRAR